MCKGEEQGDSKRSLRNCDEDSNPNISWAWMPGLRRCPWSVIGDEVWVLLTWWQDWKTLQVLPWGGSDIMDQPAYVLQAFKKCEATITALQDEQQSKQQKDLERQQAKTERQIRRGNQRK